MQQLRIAFLLAVGRVGLAINSVGGTGSPVEKVVQLLTDLKTKVGADGKMEELSYNKYACWCEKASASKAESITEAQTTLRALGQDMLTLKGQVATYASEIAQLVADIAANKKAQAEATAIREKSNSNYNAETAEMMQVLKALEEAIEVLHQGTRPSSFLQQDVLESKVQGIIDALPSQSVLQPKQRSLLSLLAGRGGSGYAPQSWTVQGILRDMYDTFAKDLESATTTEAKEWRAFEDLIAVKTKELKEAEKTKAETEAAKASAEQLLADRTQSYDDTTEQMKADISFFDETKSACKSKHDDWEIRKSLRAEELDGIDKALEILTSDEARKLFASTIKAGKETGADASIDTGVPSLLQTSGASPSAHAYSALRSTASKLQSLRLAVLAARVAEAKVGHFDKVIKAIDTMIGNLKKEGADDIAKRDQCIEEYKKTDSEMANMEWLIRKNVAKIDKLTLLIEKRTEEMEQTVVEIGEVQDHMVAITDDRKAENAAFKKSKKDDQNAIMLLQKATDVLSAYYKKNDIKMGPIQGNVKGLELDQQGPDFEVSEYQAPDAVFSGKGSRKNESKGIVQLLTMITEDLHDEIRNSMTAEEQAQLAYEKQMKAAQDLEAKLIKRKINLEVLIGKRTQEKDDEEALKADNEKDLDAETKYRESITPDCDWIMGAFATRAAKRTAEMEGLSRAKDFLAGEK